MRHGDFRAVTQGKVSPNAWKTRPVAEHLISHIRGQDIAITLCNPGIAAAPRKIAQQSADEQRHSAAFKNSSMLSQQYDNLDPQPAMQKYMQQKS